jgi:hypothetical protein
MLRALNNEEMTTMRTLETGITQEPVGPLAVLMLGYSELQVERFKRMMVDELSADMVRVISGRNSMMQGSLLEALHPDYDTPAADFEPMHPGLPHVLLLSGMRPQEVRDVIQTYEEHNFPETAFAAAVPRNLNRKLAGVVQQLRLEQGFTAPPRSKQRSEDALPSRGKKWYSWALGLKSIFTKRTKPGL